MPSLKTIDKRFMRLALAEAAKGHGLTAPNPAVGAVVVKGGRVLSKGYHHGAGLPHAEIEAISKLGVGSLKLGRKEPRSLKSSQLPDPSYQLPTTGATLYVTLEPCSSHGRTPPCTEAIIASGITRVVYGTTDPDKRHRGKAARILRNAGIKVVQGVLAEQCAALNRHWNHRHETGMPWIVAKAALSLDGRIDSPPRRRWITSAASRREAMKLRTSVEAILVGGGTVRTDNPSLTIRGIRRRKGHPQPWRVVWSKSGKIPENCKLLTDAHRSRTIILKGISLRAALRELARRGIASVLIEGGGHTHAEAFKGRLVDEVRIFIAPVIQGGQVPVVCGQITPARLRGLDFKKIGSDLMISGKPDKE
jgi:diaminohydroxyphosphoribosylaminopyrimidine deaminase/5-amino-6-(5-phosphoribosylamino)uracil reductase